MNIQQIEALSSAVSGLVEYWRNSQDNVTRILHALILEAIQDSGYATYPVIVTLVRIHHPTLLKNRVELRLRRRISDLLKAEFTVLSPLFSYIYSDLNVRYFDHGLPDYSVKVMHNIVCSNESARMVPPEEIDYTRKCLRIRYNGCLDEMVSWLLRLMAHLKTGPVRSAAWTREMQRLFEAGAPTEVFTNFIVGDHYSIKIMIRSNDFG
jgi:hypothetical protein